MRIKAALLALLIATQAHAATKYVSPTGSAAWGSATSAGSPASLTTANQNVAAGDSVIMATGIYGTFIQPQANGTSGSRIVYAGDPANPTGAVVTGIYLGGTDSGGSAGNVNWGDFVSVRWVASSGQLSLQARQKPTAYTSVKNCNITKVSAVGTLVLLSNYSILDSLTITGTGQIYMESQNLGGLTPSYNTLKNSTITLGYGGTSTWNFHWLRDCYHNTFSRNTFNWNTTQSGADAYCLFAESYQSQNNIWADNTFNIVDNSTTVLGTQGILGFRDASSYNHILRNTINVSGIKACPILSSNSGSFAGSVRGNKWEGNVIKNATAGSGGAWNFQNGARQDTIRFNTVVSGTTAPAMFFTGATKMDSCVFAHNTLYSGGGQVFEMDGTLTGTGASDTTKVSTATRFVSNIFYSTAANGSTTPTLTVDSGIALDSVGVIFSRAGNSAYAIRKFGSGTKAPVAGTGFGLSQKAVWNTPRFTDSTYAALNTTLLGSSPADDDNLHDGYAGAVGAATVDASRPAQVSPLSVTASSTSSITLSWTSVGNDSVTGTATAYDIRYSTSPITAANFASAAAAPNQPAPLVAGTATTFEVTGLSASTIYHFALKVTDGTTYSALSDTARCATSATGDVTAPAAITDVAVAPTGSTSMFVSWTQVGEDGTGSENPVANYTVKRSTSTITEGNFNAATTVTYSEQPDIAGQRASTDDTGLTAATTYYYAIKATDDAGNVSAISNVASATTRAAVDVTAPGQVTGVVAVAQSGQVLLSWVASGNDGASGGAASAFDVRYVAASGLLEAAWAAATTVSGEPTPGQPGTAHSMTITGLNNGTQYAFAIKADDAAGNHSTISTAATATPVAAIASAVGRGRRRR